MMSYVQISTNYLPSWFWIIKKKYFSVKQQPILQLICNCTRGTCLTPFLSFFNCFIWYWPANNVQSTCPWSKYTAAIQTLEFFYQNFFLLFNVCSLLLSHLFFAPKIIPQNFNFLATCLNYDRACHLLRRSFFVF